MTKAELQAEVDKLRAEAEAWRGLVAAVHGVLNMPWPDTADGPGYNARWQHNRDAHASRNSMLIAALHGYLTNTAAGKRDGALGGVAGMIGDLPAEVAEAYPYK